MKDGIGEFFLGSSTGGFTLDEFLSATGKVAMKERIGQKSYAQARTACPKNS
jgi:hypothetical protein